MPPTTCKVITVSQTYFLKLGAMLSIGIRMLDVCSSCRVSFLSFRSNFFLTESGVRSVTLHIGVDSTTVFITRYNTF